MKRNNKTSRIVAQEQPKKTPKITSYKFATVQVPKFVERVYKGKTWVDYGADNLFPVKMMELYDRCSVHRRCIDFTVDALCGKGFIPANPTVQAALMKRNDDGDDFNDILDKIAFDYAVYSAFALEIIWNKTGTRIAEVYHRDFAKIRSGVNDVHENVNDYYYSADWGDAKKFIPWRIVKYSPAIALKAAADGIEDNLRQLLYVKNYKSNSSYYPLPRYFGAFVPIQIDIQSDVQLLSYVNNGTLPSMHWHFPTGDPGDEGKFKLLEEIQAAYTGEENAGRFLMTFSDTPEQKPTVTPFTAPDHKWYININEATESKISEAHGVPGILLGQNKKGGLGNNANELETSWQFFCASVIRSIQQPVVKAFNRILFGMTGDPMNTVTISPQIMFANDGLIDTKQSTDTTIKAPTGVTTTETSGDLQITK